MIIGIIGEERGERREESLISSPACSEISCALLLQLQLVICLRWYWTARQEIAAKASSVFWLQSVFWRMIQVWKWSKNYLQIFFPLNYLRWGRQTKNFTRFQFCGRPPPQPPPLVLHIFYSIKHQGGMWLQRKISFNILSYIDSWRINQPSSNQLDGLMPRLLVLCHHDNQEFIKPWYQSKSFLHPYYGV